MFLPHVSKLANEHHHHNHFFHHHHHHHYRALGVLGSLSFEFLDVKESSQEIATQFQHQGNPERNILGFSSSRNGERNILGSGHDEQGFLTSGLVLPKSSGFRFGFGCKVSSLQQKVTPTKHYLLINIHPLRFILGHQGQSRLYQGSEKTTCKPSDMVKEGQLKP